MATFDVCEDRFAMVLHCSREMKAYTVFSYYTKLTILAFLYFLHFKISEINFNKKLYRSTILSTSS